MTIITDKVKLKWSGPIISLYKDKGYKFSGVGKEFYVNIGELLPNSNATVCVICDYCGEKYDTTYYSYKRGQDRFPKDACVNCIRKKTNEIKIRNSGSLYEKYPELIAEWHPLNEKSPKEYNYGSAYKVKWICQEKHEWESAIRDRIKGRGCPVCSESRGERRIAEELNYLKIEYKREVGFEGLIGKGYGELRYDFGIYNDKGILGLLEYDGEFHFKQIFEGDNYETTVEHDEIKNAYATTNNIPLKRIKYTEYENINKIVAEYVKELLENADN